MNSASKTNSSNLCSCYVFFHSPQKWSEMKSLSRVWLFVIPWTVAYQDPQSLGFSRQEYWSGWPFPSPGESSWPRDRTWVSRIVGRRFTVWATREASDNWISCLHSTDNILEIVFYFSEVFKKNWAKQGKFFLLYILSHSVVSNSFATPWTATWRATLSMEFSRQERWSGLSFHPPRHFPDPGYKPTYYVSPALVGRLSPEKPKLSSLIECLYVGSTYPLKYLNNSEH